MNTTLESKQTQCRCGQFGDHRDQITDYPVGSQVRAIVTLIGYKEDNNVPQGAIGRVREHCDDGRACILFGKQIHTFHYPKQCIEPIATLAESIPPHLRDDASYLRCSKCGRKSWGGSAVNSVCNLPQPTGERCDGLMEGHQD